MSQTLVLSIGADPAVLDARNHLLRSAGYIVVSAISIKEAVRLFQNGDFDLIILCDTLPAIDRERLACFVRASGSRIPIAAISGACSECNRFADVGIEDDPVEFLAGVRSLLVRHDQMYLRLSVPNKNMGNSSSTKNAPRSDTGSDRHESRADRHGTPSSERTREDAPILGM